jgi:Sec23/Sec24 trunk domain
MLELSTTTRAAPRAGRPIPQQAFGAARFLLPVQQCEFQLTGILEAFARDPWPVAHDKRALRCTGVAASVAIGPLEVCTAIVVRRVMHDNISLRRLSLTRGHISWVFRVDLQRRVQAWLSVMNSRNLSALIATSNGTAPSTTNVH